MRVGFAPLIDNIKKGADLKRWTPLPHCWAMVGMNVLPELFLPLQMVPLFILVHLTVLGSICFFHFFFSVHELLFVYFSFLVKNTQINN